MNINRNNYEEFFLLYTDKELNDHEKTIVELFVQQNSDLEEEFLMLQQSVVKPDKNVLLRDKSFLLKNESGFINNENYEEAFVLYNDNELSQDNKNETEKFINDNPLLCHEFNLLQTVKLEADKSIVFPDKKSLFKKEDDGKIIPFRWKALAAAVLLGVGLWTGIDYLRSDNMQTHNNLKVQIANNTEKKADESIIKPVIKAPIITTPAALNDVVINTKKTDQNISKQVKQRSIAATKMNPGENKLTVKIKQQPLSSHDNIKTNNLPEQIADDITAIANTLKETNAIQNERSNLEKLNSTGTLVLNDKVKNKINDDVQSINYAQSTSYITDEKNDNYVFYNVTTEEFNKSKVGGFLKKVKRFVKRKSPFGNHQADDKIQVAVN